jgi:putative flippase GtrA
MRAPSVIQALRRSLDTEFVRFLLVGAFNTGAAYGLYLGLLWVGASYLVAYALAIVIMLVVGFVLTGRFVFRQLNPLRFGLYVLAWCALLGVNLALLEVVVRIGVAKTVAPIVLLPFNALASYAVQKMVVFRRGRGSTVAEAELIETPAARSCDSVGG